MRGFGIPVVPDVCSTTSGSVRACSKGLLYRNFGCSWAKSSSSVGDWTSSRFPAPAMAVIIGRLRSGVTKALVLVASNRLACAAALLRGEVKNISVCISAGEIVVKYDHRKQTNKLTL